MKIKRPLLSMFVFVFVFIFTLFLTPSRGLEKFEELADTETKEAGAPYLDQDQNTADDSIHSLSADLRRMSLNDENTVLQQDEREEANIPSEITSTPAIGETEVSNNKDEATIEVMATEQKVNSNAKGNTTDKTEQTAANSEDKQNQEIKQQIEDQKKNEEDATTELLSVNQEYADIGISIAESYVNIRAKASTDAEILGKLHRDSAATILKTKDDWYYVESGSVTGYVSSEFIKTGLSDEELIEKYSKNFIRVMVDGLNVRKESSTDAKKVTIIYQNERYPVMSIDDDWIKIDVTDENLTGYVRSDMVELQVSFNKAVSKEEEQELERLKKEEALKKETAIKYRDGYSYSNADIKLLAALVHAEAGSQSYEGKLAVANIVINRMKSSKFPSSMKSVIYQSGQFTVASSGSLQKQLNNYGNYNTNSQKLSIKAAKSALEGANNVGNRLYFHSYKAAIRKGYDNKSNAVKIDDQLFW